MRKLRKRWMMCPYCEIRRQVEKNGLCGECNIYIEKNGQDWDNRKS